MRFKKSKSAAAIGVAIQFLKSNIHKHLRFLNITENQKKCTLRNLPNMELLKTSTNVKDNCFLRKTMSRSFLMDGFSQHYFALFNKYFDLLLRKEFHPKCLKLYQLAPYPTTPLRTNAVKKFENCLQIFPN